MTKLVLNNHYKERQLRHRHLFASTHDRVTVCDAPYVFHSAILVVRAHDVVYLGEGVTGPKILLVKIKSRFCDPEHHFVSQVLCKTLPHKNSLGDVHSIIILVDLVRTGTDTVQISTDAGSLLVFV